ncbi:MAG TPA: hypothetical protein VNH11_23220 [Pirellulales bacterium]|nr:hypothetical protein [Pirellulales bacterium]
MSKGHLFIAAAVLSAIGGLIFASWRTGGQSVAKARQPMKPAAMKHTARPAPMAAADRTRLEEQLERTLSGATLRGHMGRRQKREIEAVSPDTPYRLGKVTKLDDKGHWKLEYYIPGTDLLFDMPPVNVEWAGDLPVITITDLQIKGKKGMFRARILIDGDDYSGTWSDGKSRGCLFGTIVRDDSGEDRST